MKGLILVESQGLFFLTLQYSNTPVLQNTSQSSLAEPLKIDLILGTWFSIIEYKLMLVFVIHFLLEVHRKVRQEV
jgi:hypothetical protein